MVALAEGFKNEGYNVSFASSFFAQYNFKTIS